MRKLLGRIRALRRGGLRKVVESRLEEFERCGESGSDAMFKELCFCILTANYAAEPAMRIQAAVGDGFKSLPERGLAARLKKLGYRFPNARASYICEARRHRKGLEEAVASCKDEYELRDWLSKNVKGLGLKEASHFLRNIGFKNLAIIDFHIIDVLAGSGLIERPKTLTRKRYLEVEKVLQELGRRLGMDMAELDLYLWYLETGKVLK